MAQAGAASLSQEASLASFAKRTPLHWSQDQASQMILALNSFLLLFTF